MNLQDINFAKVQILNIAIGCDKIRNKIKRKIQKSDLIYYLHRSNNSPLYVIMKFLKDDQYYLSWYQKRLIYKQVKLALNKKITESQNLDQFFKNVNSELGLLLSEIVKLAKEERIDYEKYQETEDLYKTNNTSIKKHFELEREVNKLIEISEKRCDLIKDKIAHYFLIDAIRLKIKQYVNENNERK